MSDDTDEFTVHVSRNENDGIKVAILGDDVFGLMYDGQGLPLHSAGCTMLGDDDLRRLRDDIDRLLGEDMPAAAENPDAGEIKRQVMSDAIGAVCNIDGAVHVHLPMNANDLERATAGVLIEVAQERIRRRVKFGNDHDDEHTKNQAVADEYPAFAWHAAGRLTWDSLHHQSMDQVFNAPNTGARREQLVKACVAYAAEIEAIDRRNPQ